MNKRTVASVDGSMVGWINKWVGICIDVYID